MAQVTLRYGCNDFGGTMLEENVVSAAGCFHLASIQKIEEQIERAGFVPRQRNSWYGIVDRADDGACLPANREEAATHRASGPRLRAPRQPERDAVGRGDAAVAT
jgi:cyclic dehypoxanthinyl futalosine synthase